MSFASFEAFMAWYFKNLGQILGEQAGALVVYSTSNEKLAPMFSTGPMPARAFQELLSGAATPMAPFFLKIGTKGGMQYATGLVHAPNLATACTSPDQTFTSEGLEGGIVVGIEYAGNVANFLLVTAPMAVDGFTSAAKDKIVSACTTHGLEPEAVDVVVTTLYDAVLLRNTAGTVGAAANDAKGDGNPKTTETAIAGAVRACFTRPLQHQEPGRIPPAIIAKETAVA